MTIQPTREEFRERARRGNLVPVHQEILADMETPVSVYRKLETSEHAFLLESVENGEQVGRYSFLGADPVLVFRSKDGKQEIVQEDGTLPKIEPGATPIETLRSIVGLFEPVPDPALPPFTGGAVGYMSYDMVRYFEEIPDETEDDLQLPDCVFMLADSLVAFDHVKHRMVLIVNAHVDGDPDAAYDAAVEKLAALRKRLAAPIKTLHSGVNPLPQKRALEPTSNVTREQFEDSVRKAKDYITAGDIFQVVLSQRFTVPVTCDPFNVYRALRAINPSPYMFYLSCGDMQLAGSSPEILVRCQDGKVNLRPIAGTRPRGATPEEDRALEEDLLADEKEVAEHVMLVDLGRNDVGRVSKFGTVHVNEFKIIERYSHVMHIVSNVVGEMEDGRDAMDVLGASFPAGTVSGAPKIRAMEIIDELENVRRGPYAGSVVYFGYSGSMDSCITIRTAVIHNGKVHVQAGAGIVADSVPANEFEETRSKARGMLRAIEWAENGLD